MMEGKCEPSHHIQFIKLIVGSHVPRRRNENKFRVIENNQMRISSAISIYQKYYSNRKWLGALILAELGSSAGK